MSETFIHPQPPQEGDIYKELLICGKPFRLVYGYYEDFERNSAFNEPMPIYPDFIKNPLYTDEGIPFLTAMQDICPQYNGKDTGDSCSECVFFEKSEDLFGFCNCPENKQTRPQSTVANDSQKHPGRNGTRPDWEEII